MKASSKRNNFDVVTSRFSYRYLAANYVPHVEDRLPVCCNLQRCLRLTTSTANELIPPCTGSSVDIIIKRAEALGSALVRRLAQAYSVRLPYHLVAAHQLQGKSCC